jgi:hypothetical protein
VAQPAPSLPVQNTPPIVWPQEFRVLAQVWGEPPPPPPPPPVRLGSRSSPPQAANRPTRPTTATFELARMLSI